MIQGPENPFSEIDTNEGLPEDESISAIEVQDLKNTTIEGESAEEGEGELPEAA